MSELALILVNQDSPRSASEGLEVGLKGSKRGEACVLDFLTAMALEGRAYQVRAGTVTTPLTGDISITDTAAEMCADAPTGLVVIPVYLNCLCESHAGGTLPEIAAKAVAAISTSGTVFVPLPLYLVGGRAAVAPARVQAAGSVTVTAELATTTLRLYTNQVTAVGDNILADHYFRMPAVLQGPACFYVQVVAETAGPVYHASFEFIELPTVNVS